MRWSKGTSDQVFCSNPVSSMIEHFVVFSKAGYVLWEKTGVILRGNPVDAFIQNVLLESRSSMESYTTESYTLKWTIANEVKPGLIFLCIYAKTLTLPWIDDLLQIVKKRFITRHKDSLGDTNRFPFDLKFDELMQKATKISISVERVPQKDEDFPTIAIERQEREDTIQTDGLSDLPVAPTHSSPLKRRASTRVKRSAPGGFKKKDGKKPEHTSKSPKKQPAWKNEHRYTDEAAAALDKTASVEESEKDSAYRERVREMKERMEGGEGEDNWKDGYDDDDDEAETGGWFGSLKNLLVGKSLEAHDLTHILNDMKEHLVQKNVGHEVANDLSESVKVALVGKKLGTFGQVKVTVREAFEEELGRILTPKKSTDIVQNIRKSQAQGKPFSIVFIGVNGVGKSTSLSKICYYLLQLRFKVLIAACDTFRSGAVEQLKVHSDCLGVPVFDRGYKRDPAHVAKEAIEYAKENKFDVVLVDTAGRMQNNGPLMIALSKIITLNSPDLILFVGEAIVGNDALDQLTEFNRALMDNAKGKNPRLIDGIVLTKFDCVDDKVGTAVSMVHRTGQPIMFVGTGQKYTHLRRLNVPTVVNALLK